MEERQMARTKRTHARRRGLIERTFDELIASLNALRHVLDRPARSSPAKGAAKRGARGKSRRAASAKRAGARRSRSRKRAAA
jgi:hypothetical protein